MEELYTTFIAIISMVVTSISVIYQVKKQIRAEKKEFESWKKEQETTDINHNNELNNQKKEIDRHAEEIKKQASFNSSLEARVNNIEKDLIQSRLDVKNQIQLSMKEIIPLLEKSNKDYFEKFTTAMTHEKQLTKKELENIWNELGKKSNKRMLKK